MSPKDDPNGDVPHSGMGASQSFSSFADFVEDSSVSSAPVQGEDEYMANSLAKNEHKAVITTKWAVFSMLYIGAAALGCATYFSLSAAEDREFKAKVRKRGLLFKTSTVHHVPLLPCKCISPF